MFLILLNNRVSGYGGRTPTQHNPHWTESLLHKFRIFYAQLAAHAGATNRLFQYNIHQSSFCEWGMPLR